MQKTKYILTAITLQLLLITGLTIANEKDRSMSNSIYDYKVTTMDGSEQSLSEYKGKVLLIVNTASKCGFTPQFEGLEKLSNKLSDEEFVILGFPCNQFGQQDPGTDNEILKFCQTNYGVTFPMFSKVEVNGDNAHPLYKHLKKAAPGLLGSEAVKWNFTKFLVDTEGNVTQRFASNAKPEDIEEHILILLK